MDPLAPIDPPAPAEAAPTQEDLELLSLVSGLEVEEIAETFAAGSIEDRPGVFVPAAEEADPVPVVAPAPAPKLPPKADALVGVAERSEERTRELEAVRHVQEIAAEVLEGAASLLLGGQFSGFPAALIPAIVAGGPLGPAVTAAARAALGYALAKASKKLPPLRK